MAFAQLPSRTVAVIGAGPYGLSVAAHLRKQRVQTRVFGLPMESWRRMPERMCLKSVWSASSLADPDFNLTLDRYDGSTPAARDEPISLAFFLQYARWFQEQAVPELELSCVSRLSHGGGCFRVALADGRELQAGTVVVAIGVRDFPHRPELARGLPADLASHTGEHVRFESFHGARVAVLGSGQSALESAALLNEAGADVELISRGPVRWISRRLYRHGGVLRHLFYPPSDVGPPGLNWLCGAPFVMSVLPAGLRQRIHTRAVRPSGAQWLRPRVDGKIRITSGTSIQEAEPRGGGLRLHLSDGTERHVDHLLMGTGYRPDLDGIPFLEPSLRRRVVVRNGYPVLNRWFESSVPQLHFVGGLAGWSFGPICRFVAGARASARQVAWRVSEAA
jgi:NADPH-dependent 2,4-dienoyl-CoA reductase/sulfur reductase-like enzyme